MENMPVMLIVDDIEMNRMILKDIFADEFVLLEAFNGNEVLDILEQKQGKIDIILLDIQMPGMDGFEVLEYLSSNKVYSKIPVIANTQFGEEKNEIKALSLGAIEFISKPYNPQVIRQRVHNVLEKTVLEHKVLKKSLSNATIRLKSLIDSVPGGIAIYKVDKKLELQYFNDTVCALHGYSRDEYLTWIKDDLMTPIYEEDRQMVMDVIKKGYKEQKIAKCSFRARLKSGSFSWVSMSASIYTEDDDCPIIHMVLIDVTEEMRNEEQLRLSMKELRYHSERDSLTGIYNREMFVRITKRMLNANLDRKYMLLYSDIANFKVLNELAGSVEGDRILVSFARYLVKRIGVNGTFGRWGADNFTLCIPEDKFPIKEVCDCIQKAKIGGEMNRNFSIYFGIYEINDITVPVDQMCDRANMALQTIKGSYIRKYAFYDTRMRAALLEEQEIVNEMYDALKKDQFCAYFQPIYESGTSKLVSAEALVRWNHPTKGLISPGKFIPIFEKNGFIIRLDAYIWEYTCRYISQRIKAGQPVVPISVNVSRMNLYNPNLCDNIISLVNKYDLTPAMLKLEITETAYNDNPTQLLQMITVLQDHGFKILMDDFGSGYSSLNMLKDLSVDVLKIDMKFMDDLDVSVRADNVLKCIVTMAKSLQMSVVAEGVETSKQLEFLKNIGCDMIQGYYYSKPIPADEFTDKLVKSVKADQ